MTRRSAAVLVLAVLAGSSCGARSPSATVLRDAACVFVADAAGREGSDQSDEADAAYADATRAAEAAAERDARFAPLATALRERDSAVVEATCAAELAARLQD
ncbi:MAG TPA: hypothetical protein VGB14_18030 [Acidimicrobiales bacterium]|jgi:hypothetical protein